MHTFDINGYKYNVEVGKDFIWFYSLHSLHYEREMHGVIPQLGKEEYFYFWIATQGYFKGAERWHSYLSKYGFWDNTVHNWIFQKLKN